MSYSIETFGADAAADPKALASLHSTLLPHSPVALLGGSFMEDFYYGRLPRRKLIFGALARVAGEPAGFIVATDDSAGFMTRGIKSYWPTLCFIGMKSLVSPSRVAAIWEAVQIMRNLDPAPAGAAHGEMLSFGVLPQFRTKRFIAETGHKIGQDLLRRALDLLRARGVASARAIVDADNLQARLFYLGMGWSPGSPKVAGWRKETVEFLWRDAEKPNV